MWLKNKFLLILLLGITIFNFNAKCSEVSNKLVNKKRLNNSTSSNKNEIIVLSPKDLSCYSCLSPTSSSTECTCESNRCAIKAKNLNSSQVASRRCTEERWVYELLYDGCLIYKNEYLCICSSSFCNGGSIKSIRGEDNCSSNPCPSGSICLDTFDGFKCMCPPWQTSCTYQQPSNCPCHNGGLCVALPNNNMACSCRYGFTGDFCEKIEKPKWLCDEYLSYCNRSDGTYCKKNGENFDCKCRNGYYGFDCQFSIFQNFKRDEILTNLRHNLNQAESRISNLKTNRILELEYSYLENKKQESKLNKVIQKREIKEFDSSPNFKRIKYIEITDDYSDYSDQQETEDAYDVNYDSFVSNQEEEEITPLVSERIIRPDNPCYSNPCKIGDCEARTKSYYCKCPFGFTGINCELSAKSMCPKINPCQNNGQCINFYPNFKCVCSQGYNGTYCEKKINKCELENPCKNDATCISLSRGLYCICNSSFTGKYCDKYVCPRQNPCMNDGQCIPQQNGIVCICKNDFTGERCQYRKPRPKLGIRTIQKDTCKTNKFVCLNNGLCVNTLKGYKCQCLPNFTGPSCEFIDYDLFETQNR